MNIAQLFPPSNPAERVSQLLPSVKCSNCNQPVALSELGDHICAPPPSPSKPSPSQAILAKIRSANNPSSPPPDSRQPPRRAQSPPRSMSPAVQRTRTPQPQPPRAQQQTMPQRMQSPAPPPPRLHTPIQQQPMQPPQTPRGLPSQIRSVQPSPPRGYQQQGPQRVQTPLSVTGGPNANYQRPAQHQPLMRPPNNVRPPMVPTQPPPPPQGDPRGNGEVNMAGVGRRGFQAAAQAAMLAASVRHNSSDLRAPSGGMDGRRLNAPRQLNINAAFQQDQGQSLSPNTPMSTYSPHSPSPLSSPHSIPQPGIAASRTPSPISHPFASLQPPMPPKSPDTIRAMTPDTIRALSPLQTQQPARSRFSGGKQPPQIDTSPKLQDKNIKRPDPFVPMSPGSESDYSSSGLAYDRDSDSMPSPTLAPSSIVPSSSGTEVASAIDSPQEKVLFPAFSPKAKALVSLPARSVSSGSAYSYASRTTSRSTGALDRAMDTLRERNEDPMSPPSHNLPMSPPTKSPKLPARARTTPAMSTKDDATDGRTRSRPRQCTKCNKKIEDGRWIKAEGAGVLCERCWKTMYLPKCRRCNRPIEKQAVSSADGQLKGKYHRECFNCHKCHKPFPDKEFYVYDGKPFCRYHYHEENDSLCAARLCGQPIEGACAVAHTGERYHPECLVCEHEYPPRSRLGKPTRCNERLAEYWEVDGRMLCERHAMRPPREGDIGAEGLPASPVARREAEARARRRQTQFIDLR